MKLFLGTLSREEVVDGLANIAASQRSTNALHISRDHPLNAVTEEAINRVRRDDEHLVLKLVVMAQARGCGADGLVRQCDEIESLKESIVESMQRGVWERKLEEKTAAAEQRLPDVSLATR